jgi:uncharacterized membrane protein (DUF106 family)
MLHIVTSIIVGLFVVAVTMSAFAIDKLKKTVAVQQKQVDELKRELEEMKGKLNQ